MISVSDAENIISKILGCFGTTNKEILADRDYPPIHRVMMDGIALNFDNYLQGQRKFKIVGVVAAGSITQNLKDKNTAIEIMTGASLPNGTDVVVPYEWLDIKNGVATITSDQVLKKFDHIHLKGSDCHKNQVLLFSGAEISGPNSGIAASTGLDIQELCLNPKVLIISTGDELVEINQPVLPHQLRRSNVHALKTSLMLHGFFNIELAHLKDDQRSIEEHYQQATQKFDLLIYSGGVSKGKFDYLPAIWNKLGVEQYIHGVTQRPGKPLWFGQDHQHKTVVLGLPGNPVSSLVCLHRYLLCKKSLNVKIMYDLENNLKLTKFLPVKLHSHLNAELEVSPLEIKNSGEFTALAGSDGFIELDPFKKYRAGADIVRFFPWRSM